jgi:predicted lipid-binding transport protein (Tim44 family)
MVGKLVGPLLLGILIASAALNLWASVRFFFSLRELYKLQAWAQYINSTQSAAQSLASESVEYAKQHPAFEPVLQRFTKPKAVPAPPQAAPPPKPTR